MPELPEEVKEEMKQYLSEQLEAIKNMIPLAMMMGALPKTKAYLESRTK
jgi:hypothetical protein